VEGGGWGGGGRAQGQRVWWMGLHPTDLVPTIRWIHLLVLVVATTQFKASWVDNKGPGGGDFSDNIEHTLHIHLHRASWRAGKRPCNRAGGRGAPKRGRQESILARGLDQVEVGGASDHRWVGEQPQVGSPGHAAHTRLCPRCPRGCIHTVQCHHPDYSRSPVCQP